MVVKNWLARKGNVGGIARSVAEGWKEIESQNPEISPKEIAEAYTNVRFGLVSEPEATKILNDISQDEITTPLQLAWSVFKSKNKDGLDVLVENYAEWIKIMREEMEKKGVNPDLKW